MDTGLRKLQVPLFFVLAYAITWSVQIPAYLFAHSRGQNLDNESNLLHLLALFGGNLDPGFALVFLTFSFSFGPSVAGIVVTALFHGRAGLKNLFRRAVRVRIPARWIAIIVLVPLGLSLASVLLGYAISGFAPLRYSFVVPLGMAIPFLVSMIVFTGMAEEFGWRGYALPQLQRTRTAEKASWILGFAWGLWHLPSNMLLPLLRNELTIPMAVTVLLGLTFGAVGWTIVLTWIYNSTGSLFWIIVLHGLSNTIQSYVVLSSGNYTAQVIFGVLPWAIALWVLKRYGADTLTRVPPAAAEPVASGAPPRLS
ncbi:CPBP family intramembrane glutamic endopeptidase [Arthrobacter sp. Br18]|uniref:CPBP family intramembrane glutamic endopeptidase n=1 Tax=Arthrobacter sp. Br18 TaxID=1312954 RepID=UPI000686DDDA|nr:CPBP family intramembrane glutamic endopeptidase [Arthrobacter sp. Br18]